MIGPRGNRENSWGDVQSPETFFDPTVENVQENPPKLFEPKTPEQRRVIAEVRAMLPAKPSGFGDQEEPVMSRDARKLAASVIFDDSYKIVALPEYQSGTGREIADVFRKMFGK